MTGSKLLEICISGPWGKPELIMSCAHDNLKFGGAGS